MPTSTTPLSLQHPQGLGTVHFVWTHDRFDHTIDFDGRQIACRNGTGEQAWPESPPIQQLSIESIDGRDVALGVGCAGTSHWSLSVEPTPEGFRFDWACRAKETPEQLGTTYHDSAAIQIEPAAASNVTADTVTDTASTRIRPDGVFSGGGTYRWCYAVRLREG
ncbi:hypothetical protein [Planctomycetes bacterium TBK1r]|uniref:Uncharacterized protein n=1 Tax=Stieleria magnilauensis TaxID=2527963 RepID=A0ABX5Y3X5_9BACT|nr:hypothetical protein TBK1r_57890 [Planctomycetes bacterium TBK1r]